MLTTALLALAFLVTSVPQPPADKPASAAASGVPTERLARLAKGVNLSHWFWLPENSLFADAKYFTKEDAAALKASGVTHVRLPIDPGRFFTSNPGVMNRANTKKLTEAVDMILAADLAVVVEIHALGTSSEKKYDKALHDPANEEGKKLEAAFIENWGALASALAEKDPGRVFLEILNEPVYDKHADRWYEIQAKVAASIRAKAPSHTIIATGTQWGSLSGLLELKPLADANVVYSFHFYEPHTFTHQGATWGSDNWKHLKSVPYPGTPEAVAAVLDGIKDPAARGEVKWYGDQGWNADKITKRIGKAAAWGKTHGVAVWCGEFGAIFKAPAESRAAWLRDVRSACEMHVIGWCMWDYAGSFAFATGAKGSRSIDPVVAEALGLSK
jgi:aryl-phospho-beta-D-glucosidase BglC (GH1 family)